MKNEKRPQKEAPARKMESPRFDPQGSYTGKAKDDPYPVQDADDL